MDPLETLGYSIGQLRGVVDSLDESEMDTPTNCEPWTVRQLASHALNNQLLWAGIVTGLETVSLDDAMGAVPIEGDLSTFAADVAERVTAMWSTDGVLAANHATPFGELPGSVVVNFPIWDSLIHSWDISEAVGRPIELSAEARNAISVVMDSPYADGARDAGLIAPPTDPPPDASETELLMASAGRSSRHMN